MTKTRVMAFIDGYNLYHAVDEMDLNPKTGRHLNLKYHLKWVNLWSLCEAFTMPSKEELAAVFYFSAYATWKPESTIRHRSFVKAQEAVGVTVVMGRFREKHQRCRKCGDAWVGHEEKATDVNIALHLLDQAYQDKFDRALILTADTDLIPAVQMVRERFPDKVITALLPNTRYIAGNAMKSVCHGGSYFKESHLNRNLLPAELTLNDGQILKRPDRYAPPRSGTRYP